LVSELQNLLIKNTEIKESLKEKDQELKTQNESSNRDKMNFSSYKNETESIAITNKALNKNINDLK